MVRALHACLAVSPEPLPNFFTILFLHLFSYDCNEGVVISQRSQILGASDIYLGTLSRLNLLLSSSVTHVLKFTLRVTIARVVGA